MSSLLKYLHAVICCHLSCTRKTWSQVDSSGDWNRIESSEIGYCNGKTRIKYYLHISQTSSLSNGCMIQNNSCARGRHFNHDELSTGIFCDKIRLFISIRLRTVAFRLVHLRRFSCCWFHQYVSMRSVLKYRYQNRNIWMSVCLNGGCAGWSVAQILTDWMSNRCW